MLMLGAAYQTRNMKMCQQLTWHPWTQSLIVQGGTVHFKVRAIFSTLRRQQFNNGHLHENDG
jgi:hypothetical protein